MIAQSPTRSARGWLFARSPALVLASALTLVVGCGGTSGPRDAGTDLQGDASPKTDLGGGDTHADTTAKQDTANDGHADAGADQGTDALAEVRPDSPSADVPAMAFCPAIIPALTVDSGTVTGVLQGASNNPAVSCRGGVPTLGPEAFFTLTVTQQTTVTFTVAAPVDTIVAIRPGPCSDTISEIACGEQPPVLDADAGVQPSVDAGPGTRLSGVTAPLAPGTYTVVVDTYTLGNLSSAPFSLAVGHLAPAPNASCNTPTLLTLGMTASAQPLDRAGAARSVCGGTSQSSLFYSVGVPAGQRLTARAVPKGGDRAWMPRLSAFASCTSNTCIAQGHVVSGTTQQLDWVNNGSSWQLVDLAVGADSPVSGATFDLTVSSVDLFATCARPMNVVDGTIISNQDLSLAATPTGQTCTGDHAFYYSADLLPQQTITVDTRPSSGSTSFTSPDVSFRTSCDSQTSCLSTGSGSMFTNQSDQDLQIIVEVSSGQASFVGPFDLTVSMPDPPPGIIVTPTTGLVTTESGGTATFTVKLASPPTADVTIALASDTPTEGTASPASLTFTSANWRTPQTVTVTGVDDNVPDGPRDYTIVTSPATSDDGRYSGLDADDVSVTNFDTDPGVSFVGSTDVVTSESGATATFGVVLNAAPTADVTMTLASSDVGEATVSPAQLTFTAANWNVPQTVTVTGVDDAIVDGTQTYTIVTGVLTSADARYAGQNPPDITGRNLDDDQVPVALKVVSGDHVCASPQPFPIAVDMANQLYLVMQCETGLFLTTSTDAGVTFTDPVEIPGTDLFNGAISLAGGAPGFAYLLFSGNDNNVYFTRTADGGATWSNRVTVSNRTDVMRMAAGDRTIVIVTAVADGSNRNVFSRSVDGGRTFLPKAFVAGMNNALGVERDGQTVWSVELVTNGNELQKSTDAAATFQKVGDITQNIDNNTLIGHANLFTFSGNTLQIVKLADTTQEQDSITFLSVPPFSMTVDDLDTLAILDTDPNGHLRGTRVMPGQAPPTGGRSLGPSPSSAGLAVLSRKAAGVAVQNGNLVLYTTVVW
jgi:hypothetical protein